MADEQETSLREDIEAAAETVEGPAEETTTNEVQSTSAQETEGEATETETEVSGESAEVAEQPGEPAAEPTVEAHAPVDWPDEVKEQWSKLDPQVQAAISTRERHVNEVLQQSAGAREAVETFQGMIQPYIPLMQAEGVTDPLTAVNGLLQTTAALSLGSPQQKAQKIANLINHYGVDVQTLADALDGKAPDPQTSQFEQMLNERLAPVNQLLQRVNQAEQQSAQQVQQETTQTIEQFAQDPKNVHFNTVRTVMADFLDLAAQNGQDMTLDQAYERACMAVPEVATKVMSERANGIAGQNQQTLAGKRAAAASVHGQPGAVGTGGIEEGLSLRETLEQAAGLHGGGRI